MAQGENIYSTKQQDFIIETPIEIEELDPTTGTIIKYERGKFLGKGGFAKCYELKRVDNGRIYAAKIIDKQGLYNGRSKKKLINEIKIHKKLNNSNIVGFEKFFEDKDNVYILLELCSNQTLRELVKRRKRLNELEVQCYTLQIIRALKYLHNHRIIHRDLKLGNLFLTSKLELKLGDFGLAAKLEYDGQRRKTVCGTPNYVAPEILEKKNGHSYEVDIWSLGIVIYTMLFGVPPFDANDEKIIYKKIKMNSYKFPDSIKVENSAKKLISSLLNLDPSKRPSLDSIIEHDFFKIYHSVPLILPISTLSCPLSQKYISEFLKSDSGNAFESKLNYNYSYKENLEINNENDNKNRNEDKDGNLNYDLIQKISDDDSLKIKLNLDNLNISQIPPDKRYFCIKISKFFDYSSKFGYVYFINNSHFAICFNDFTNLIKTYPTENPENNEYLYYERDGKLTLSLSNLQLKEYLDNENTSKDMIKKFEIFKRILEKHNKNFKEVLNKKNEFIPFNYMDKEGEINSIFIKRFLASRNGVLFRLNNKLIQIFFNDDTEIDFSTESSKFLYINKEKKEINEDIRDAVDINDVDLNNKIKISKNMLIYFVKKHKSKKVPK